MTRSSAGRRRTRGSIDLLPSGALRVRVYAGKDPVSGRRHDLIEVVPPGPKAAAQAEAARTRLLNQVDERRQPRTRATVSQLLDRYFEVAAVERTTLSTYRGYAKKHILPLIGDVAVGALDADVFDSFYAELRRCREHCDRRPYVEHRTDTEHACDDRCRAHVCRPLGPSTMRQIHFILSGALKRAVRWRWIATSPITQAEPPAAPKPDPQPPSAKDAARIVGEAWADPDWGTLIWLAMVTGLRRGELCALRWRNVDLDAGTLSVRRGIWQRDGRVGEKDTKTHQQRRLALDDTTVSVLATHRRRWEERVAELGAELADDAFVFSLAPDGSAHLLPDSVSQRFGDLAKRLDIVTSIHKLRHYSATELISAGVDVRTVAGRLGHGGGGTTTLRYYTAFVSESDQRAALSLGTRMPAPPTEPAPRSRAPHPYETLAAVLREAIRVGRYPIGSFLPGQKALAVEHDVALGTAHRASSLLAEEGLVEVEPGRGFRVLRLPEPVVDSDHEPAAHEPRTEPTGSAGTQLLDLALLHRGDVVSRFCAEGDASDPADLRELLRGAVLRRGGSEEALAEYELEVRRTGSDALLRTFVAAGRR